MAAWGGGRAADPAAAAAATSDGFWYNVDDAKLERVRETKAWVSDPKYFKKVQIGPSAAMKMLSHTYSGVERGIKEGGKPVEVMGLLLGRPHTEELTTMVVTDAFPLPIEGFETRVLADDENVTNYMVLLGETLEKTRKEIFMGWYHSHPFDVDEQFSHCYLSNTDLTTQLSWQRSEDRGGNPFLAIVIDPLRSLAKNYPEFGAFRVYPPDYNAPLNETPDGKIVEEDRQRVEQWGACWNRYYKLDIEYFMSAQARAVIAILSKNYLWARTLGSTPMLERENRERFSERITNLSTRLDACDVQMAHGLSSRLSGMAGTMVADGGSKDESPMAKPTASAQGLATEVCEGQMTQIAKNVLFG